MAEKEQFAVHLKDDIDADNFAEEHGFKNLGIIGNLENMYLFEIKEDTRTRNVVPAHETRLNDAPSVIWFEKQVTRTRSKRDF